MRPQDGKERVRLWVDRGYMWPERRVVESLHRQAEEAGDAVMADHYLEALTDPSAGQESGR